MIGKKTFLAAIGLAAALATGGFAQNAPPPGGPGGPGGPPAGPRARASARAGTRMVERFFANNDANKDGKVTLEEMTARAKELLKAADTDQDGSITKEEMTKYVEKKRAERSADRPRPGPGAGNGPQAGKGPPGGGPGAQQNGLPGPGGPQAGRRFGRRPSPEEIFKRMDTNGDGEVSLEEFKAFHEKMMHHRGRPDRGPPPGGGR